MYKRPEESYRVDEQTVNNILRDEASPLSQIVNQIPINAKILDIGAGNGLLGQLFQVSGKTVVIDGIEPNEYASKIAKEHYRKLFNGYLSSFIDELKQEIYDYIILADVIEHIADPIEFIEEIKSIMNDNAKLIFSIPNVAYGSVRINLLFGKFQYTDSGVLEKTHLRFYTEDTIFDLMKHSKLNIEKLSYLHRDIFSIEKSKFLSKIKFSSLCEIISDKNSHVYQFLLVVNKNNKSKIDYIEIGEKKENCYLRILKFKLRPFLRKIKQTIKKVLYGN